MSMSFVFIDRLNNGSCISLLDSKSSIILVRKMPTIGGLADMQLFGCIGWILNLAMPLLDTMLQLFTNTKTKKIYGSIQQMLSKVISGILGNVKFAHVTKSLW